MVSRTQQERGAGLSGERVWHLAVRSLVLATVSAAQGSTTMPTSSTLTHL